MGDRRLRGFDTGRVAGSSSREAGVGRTAGAASAECLLEEGEVIDRFSLLDFLICFFA
jgi:hypothetical protein